MKQIKKILTCCLTTILVVSCSDNSLVYNGSKLTEKPTQPVSTTEQNILIDECNGQLPNCFVLDFTHSDTIQLKGWGADFSEKTNLKEIILHVGSKYISAKYGIERNDVKDFIGSNVNTFGFEFCFSKELLKENDGFLVDQIELIGITNKNEQTTPIQFSLLKEPSIPSLPIHERNLTIANGGIYIDSYFDGINTLILNKLNPITIISGWAFDTETLSPLSNIYIKFGKHTLECKLTERLDVQSTFNLNDNMVGFTVEIPTYLLKDNLGNPIESIEIIGINSSNEYIYTPQPYLIQFAD